jgi:large subunit ribosomal protein L4
MEPHKVPKQAWLETLSCIENEKLGIIDLHPDVFSVFPRIDLLHENIQWQLKYRKINYTKQRNRAEMWGGGRKPWRQKGTGRARHGSIRSPLWIKGGKSFGPRGPESYFYMLSTSKRVQGLATALSIKYAQDNLHIVDSLQIPSDEPDYIEELIESRGWGLSVLFINDLDIIPENIGVACQAHKSYNIMAAYGLNVYSMLKHETLILTLPALEHIEKCLLAHMHAADAWDYKYSKSAWHQPIRPMDD